MIARDFFDRLGHGTHRVRCPECSDTRKPAHRKERTFVTTVDYEKAIYHCHHCGISGRTNMTDNIVSFGPASSRVRGTFKPETQSSTTSQPKPQPLPQSENPLSLGTDGQAYLRSRGISIGTAEKYGVYEQDHFIRDQGEVKCIAFPYISKDGTHYATKFRSTEDKGFAADGAPREFFGLQMFLASSDYDIIIAEGEIDALSFAEVGHLAVSIPNGANKKFSGEGGFDYLWEAKDILDGADRIILALDNDEPGKATAEEIARRLGKARCWRVVWPDGVKDANDILVRNGDSSSADASPASSGERLRELIDDAEPWPVSGLYDANHFYKEVVQTRSTGLNRGLSTGYPSLDDLYSIDQGQLTIVTGAPGAGKSEFVDQLMCNLAETHGWTFAICSFENEPRIHITKLISKRARKPFWDQGMSDVDFEVAYQWVQEHFTFIYHTDGTLSTLDDILDRLGAAVMRYGIRGVVIDPYNYIMRDKNLSETDWISEMLTKVKVFCTAHGVHCWFVAHPTKLRKNDDGVLPVAGGYDISGSAAWFAKTDNGLTVYRKEGSEYVSIHIWKIRFQWNGRLGATGLKYNPRTTRYDDGDVGS